MYSMASSIAIPSLQSGVTLLFILLFDPVPVSVPEVPEILVLEVPVDPLVPLVPVVPPVPVVLASVFLPESFGSF